MTDGGAAVDVARQAPPRIRRQKNYRGTPERESFIESVMLEVDGRRGRQSDEREPTDAELIAAWRNFPDGIGIVMRASEAAQAAFWCRGGAAYKLTILDILRLMIRCRGRCEVSGVPFSGEVIGGCVKRPFIPSIDRIDARGCYEFDNCRLVCWAVNKALGEWGDDVFWRIVRCAAER